MSSENCNIIPSWGKALTQLKDFITKSRQHKQKVRCGPNNKRLYGMCIFKDRPSWPLSMFRRAMIYEEQYSKTKGSLPCCHYYYQPNIIKSHFKYKEQVDKLKAERLRSWKISWKIFSWRNSSQTQKCIIYSPWCHICACCYFQSSWEREKNMLFYSRIIIEL